MILSCLVLDAGSACFFFFFIVRLVLRCEEYNEAAISGTQVSYDINSFKLKVIERLSSTSVVLQQ